MKYKKKLIIPLLITLVIGMIIILGIIVLNKTYLKENFTAAEAEEMGKDISKFGMDQLSAANIPTENLESALSAATTGFSDLMDKENQAREGNNVFTNEMDLSGSVINTTSDKCTNKSFFEGIDFSDGFCETYAKNPSDLNNNCARLTNENCSTSNCCILLNGKTCVAGNANGPTFLVDNENNDIDYAYYSHKNECYGSCGKGNSKSANPCSAYKDIDPNVSKQCLERLWNQNKCPNNYITNERETELKDYSKLSIKRQFKEAILEENYDKCYGPEGGSNPWPVACHNTEPSTFNLSGRCLTKLYNDVGCTNNSMINDVYVADNKLEPKSAMINKFAEIKNGINVDSYTKCYGRDESTWPDPCLGVAETAVFSKDEIPFMCARKIWRDETKCPNSDLIKYFLYDTIKNNKSESKTSLAEYRKIFQKNKDHFLSNRVTCYGSNPNSWPDVESKLNDPCINLNYDTLWKNVMPNCKKRIMDLVDDNNEGKQMILKNNKSYGEAPAFNILQMLAEEGKK